MRPSISSRRRCGGRSSPRNVQMSSRCTRRAVGACSEHELAEREHVAATRPPQRGRRVLGERPLERDVQQRVDIDLVELAEVDSRRPLVAPPSRDRIRHRGADDDRGDAEQRPLRHQTIDDRQRRGVERVGVVEQQHRDAGFVGRRHEDAAGRLEQSGEHRRIEARRRSNRRARGPASGGRRRRTATPPPTDRRWPASRAARPHGRARGTRRRGASCRHRAGRTRRSPRSRDR